MGTRSVALSFVALAACHGGASTPTGPAAQASIQERVVHDFETAVLAGKDPYVNLFDFAIVGEYEILLHRYDLNGRASIRLEKRRAEFEAEDGTPYPEARERRNVGNFYPLFVQRTVGTGGCKPVPPRTRYAQKLATIDPLPEGTPPKYATLVEHAKAWTAKGGVVGIQCTGGKGNLSVVYTEKPGQRGYDLITIYDD